MPDRRQFLHLTTMAGAAAALAACSIPDHPTAAAGVATLMTCPDVTAGSVSGQSGAVNGWTTAFVDAYSDRQGMVETPGVNSFYQYPVVLSDKAGVGVRYQQNKVVKGEHWLLLTLNGARLDDGPLPFHPTGQAMAVLQNLELPAGSGNTYKVIPTYVAKSSKNCNANEETATGGTVTLSYIDVDRVEGSYDLTFGTDRIQGSFVAPRAGTAASMDYSGCPTRPSQQTCVAA